MTEFILFAVVGFLAQAVDGALGMAYGAISSTVLLSFGVPPAQASASVHAAEVFTTGASGYAHHYHRNIDWKLFWWLRWAPRAGSWTRRAVADGDRWWSLGCSGPARRPAM